MEQLCLSIDSISECTSQLRIHKTWKKDPWEPQNPTVVSATNCSIVSDTQYIFLTIFKHFHLSLKHFGPMSSSPLLPTKFLRRSICFSSTSSPTSHVLFLFLYPLFFFSRFYAWNKFHLTTEHDYKSLIKHCCRLLAVAFFASFGNDQPFLEFYQEIFLKLECGV